MMKKFLYWMTRRFHGSGRFCRHFCPACEYYEICHTDGAGQTEELP